MHDHHDAHIAAMTLRPSFRLAAMLTVAHLAIAGLLMTLALPSWAKITAVLLLLVNAAWTVHRHALRRSRRSITELAFSDRETLRLTLRDGSSHGGRILGSSTVGTSLVLLNIAIDGRRLPVHVVLLGDSLAEDDFRRLRVWLRWGPRPPAEEPAVS
jgi:toxin CptA